MLKNTSGVDPVTEFRFFTIVILGRPVSPEFRSGITFPYFRELISLDELPARFVEAIPDDLDHALPLRPLKSGPNEARDIIAELYADPLRPSLEKWAVGKQNGYRINAFWVLEKKGWLTQEIRHAYHMKNLLTYKQKFAAFFLVDSVKWVGANVRGPDQSTAVKSLETIKKGTQGQIDLARAKNDEYSLRVYGNLNRVAQQALSQLQAS